MSVPIHVNVIWDPTLGFNFHTLWDPVATAAPPPGVPKPNTPVPALEMIAIQMWTAGYFLGQNKFSTTVMHKGVPMCVEDHDIGILIPDITYPVVNLWYLIQWPFSGRKMAFQCAAVQMDGKPTSCSQIAPIPLPMMTCGDPLTLPLSFPLINWLNPLTVGFTLADFLKGLISIAISIAIEAFFEWGIPGIGKAVSGKVAKEGAEAAGEKVAKEVAEEAAEEAGEKVAKEVAEEATESYGKNLAKNLGKEALGKLGLTPKAAAKKAVDGLAGTAQQAAWGEDNPSFKTGVGGGPVPELGVQIGGSGDEDGRFGTNDVGGVPVGGVVGNTPSDPLNVL